MSSQKTVVRQANVADLDLLVPLFDAYRQFYRQPSDPNLARRFCSSAFSTINRPSFSHSTITGRAWASRSSS